MPEPQILFEETVYRRGWSPIASAGRSGATSVVPAQVLLALALLASTLLATAAAAASGNHEESPASHRHYDARLSLVADQLAEPTATQRVAVATLRARVGDLAVTYDPATGVTRSLSHRIGYLTEHRAGDALDIATDFLHEHRAVLGLTVADLENLEITDRVVSAVTGATHLYLRQTHAGIPVYNGQLHVNLNRDGRILSVNNAFLPNLALAVGSIPVSALSARDAVNHAAQHSGFGEAPVEEHRAASGPGQRTVLEAPALSRRPIVAELFWLPMRRGEARLVWSFQLQHPVLAHHFDVTVDATTGDLLTRIDWVHAASYRVFAQPAESPNHAPSPPPADGRTLVIDPQDAAASPLGWHNDGTTAYTVQRGNNAHAFDDLDGDGLSPTVEPDCGATLDCDFDFPIDFGTADPLDYTAASVTNLFYWSNLMHDVQYQYGFDEAAGNFQTDNFGNGGVGGDAILAKTQSAESPCPNGAFFDAGPDGMPGELQMCLWTNSTPRRDFSWDAGVVVHEYGHAISSRLVGGPSNASCLGNQQSPSEGLSDWWALVYTHEVGDTGADLRGIGTYFLGEPVDGPGIRPQHYSTDSAVNDFTYESITGLAVPHGVGSVWGQVAWEVYWALVDHHGFDPDLYDAFGGSGNQRMMLYVNEGLKNTACSPSFLDTRDGIVQAAIDNYGGEDVCRIWEAFAAFGLGTDAVGTNSSLAVTNGFTVPEACDGLLFTNGFESGDTTGWSSVVGGS